MLPRLPSAEVIREIRKKGGATAPPIILMMTGYRGTNRKADAQKVGAFDILQRPFSDEDFLGSVREAIEATDVGAKTMRIETAQAAAAPSPLTSSDIFSDVLDELRADASKKRPTPAEPPAAAPPRTAAPAAPPPRASRHGERRRQAPARHALGSDAVEAGSRRPSGSALRQDSAADRDADADAGSGGAAPPQDAPPTPTWTG